MILICLGWGGRPSIFPWRLTPKIVKIAGQIFKMKWMNNQKEDPVQAALREISIYQRKKTLGTEIQKAETRAPPPSPPLRKLYNASRRVIPKRDLGKYGRYT